MSRSLCARRAARQFEGRLLSRTRTDEWDTGEHEPGEQIGPRRRRADRDPTAEGVADREHRPVRDLGEARVQQRGVFARPPGLRRLRRRPEPGEVEHDCVETAQSRFEIVAITAPAVQTDDAGRPLAEHVAEQTTVREGPQHGCDATGERRFVPFSDSPVSRPTDHRPGPDRATGIRRVFARPQACAVARR